MRGCHPAVKGTVCWHSDSLAATQGMALREGALLRPSPVPPPSSPLGVVPEGALSSPPDHSKVPSRLDDTREKTTLREGQRDAGRQGVGWRRARAAGGVSGAAEPLRPRTSGCSHKRAALRGRKGEWPVCASP